METTPYYSVFCVGKILITFAEKLIGFWGLFWFMILVAKQPWRGLMILFFSLPMLSSKVATPIWWFNTSCFESFLIYCLQCIVQCGSLQKWSFKGSLFSKGILSFVPLPKKGVKSRPWAEILNFLPLTNSNFLLRDTIWHFFWQWDQCQNIFWD